MDLKKELIFLLIQTVYQKSGMVQKRYSSITNSLSLPIPPKVPAYLSTCSDIPF